MSREAVVVSDKGSPKVDFPARESGGPEVPAISLRPREAALALGIGERKLWELTHSESSGIPHVRFGKVIVYPVKDLERWLSEQATNR